MSEFSGATIMLGAVTETESLRKTIEYVASHCDKKDIEEFVISVSPNATVECLKMVEVVTSADYGITVRTIAQKCKGIETIKEIMEEAKGSHCLLLASDMASNLDFVPAMIEGVKKEPNVIFKASRWLKGCRFYGYGKVRLILNFMAQIFLRCLYQRNIKDMTTPLQIAQTELYHKINWEYEGFAFLLEMVLKPVRLGYKFKEIPTNCFSRTQGKSNNSFKQTLNYLPAAIHIRFMKKKDILK